LGKFWDSAKKLDSGFWVLRLEWLLEKNPTFGQSHLAWPSSRDGLKLESKEIWTERGREKYKESERQKYKERERQKCKERE
jgi:hypothetical protein